MLEYLGNPETSKMEINVLGFLEIARASRARHLSD